MLKITENGQDYEIEYSDDELRNMLLRHIERLQAENLTLALRIEVMELDNAGMRAQLNISEDKFQRALDARQLHYDRAEKAELEITGLREQLRAALTSEPSFEHESRLLRIQELELDIAIERDACAKIAENVNNYDNPMTAQDIADSIMARQ